MRHLRYGIGQTLLCMGVVAISVTLIVFLGALIGGLQKKILATMTGAIPHVVVSQPERQPLATWDLIATDDASPSAPLYVGSRIKLEQRRRKIEDWAEWLPRLETFDREVLAVSPAVEGPGFIERGARRAAVSIKGVSPERHNRIVDIQGYLVEGRFFGLNSGEAAIGYTLAQDFGLKLGDRIRLTSDIGNNESYLIAGVFDSGFRALDKDSIFLVLEDAQSLFGLGRAVTTIGMRLDHVLEADAIAARLALQVPYQVDSWMQDNQSQLAGLRAQNQSSNMIIAFTTAAAGFGIASILITAVVGKLREIGILKAMGATQSQIIRVFTLEGVILAFFGGLAGAAQGVGLSLFLLQFRQSAGSSGRETEIFPMDLTPQLVVTGVGMAVVVGFLASLYPAWRAARVNPIDVIRGL